MTNTLLVTLLCCVGGLVGSAVLTGLAMSSHLILALVIDIFGRLFDRNQNE